MVNLLLKKLLVGTDFSENSERAIKFALTLAENLKASVTLLNIVYPPTKAASELEYPFPWVESFLSDWKKYNEQALTKLVAKYKEKNPNVQISMLIKEGQPAHEIAETAKHFDAVVIGQKGRAMPEALMGGVCEKVATLSRCPVIIVP
jgi:nucleotide-binding universal stress UspA family protein